MIQPVEVRTAPRFYPGMWAKDAVPEGDTWPHPGERLIAVIGRGHSGTRAISQQIHQGGAYMGRQRNNSQDCPMPFRPLYQAARIAGSLARLDKASGLPLWDFSALTHGPIPAEAKALLWEFLSALWEQPNRQAYAWKLPETTFVFPWLARLYPEALFIHWVRDPRDVISKNHGTDLLEQWGVEHGGPVGNNMNFKARAWSWIYQDQIVRHSAEVLGVKHVLPMTLEFWARNQGKAVEKLREFTGLQIKPLAVKPGVVGKWRGQKKTQDWNEACELLAPSIAAHGYPPNPSSD